MLGPCGTASLHTKVIKVKRASRANGKVWEATRAGTWRLQKKTTTSSQHTVTRTDSMGMRTYRNQPRPPPSHLGRSAATHSPPTLVHRPPTPNPRAPRSDPHLVQVDLVGGLGGQGDHIHAEALRKAQRELAAIGHGGGRRRAWRWLPAQTAWSSAALNEAPPGSPRTSGPLRRRRSSAPARPCQRQTRPLSWPPLPLRWPSPPGRPTRVPARP